MKSKLRSSTKSRWQATIEEDVEAVLRQLTPREENVLRLRFSTGNSTLGIDAVAAHLALTPNAVQRIERSALRKLRLVSMMDEEDECANVG